MLSLLSLKPLNIMSNFVDNLFVKGMRLRMKETKTNIASVLHVADTIVKAVFSVFI